MSYYVSLNYFILTCMLFFFFFFQAEDGIRDKLVTGVQTCALPIWVPCGSRALCCSDLLMPTKTRIISDLSSRGVGSTGHRTAKPPIITRCRSRRDATCRAA